MFLSFWPTQALVGRGLLHPHMAGPLSKGAGHTRSPPALPVATAEKLGGLRAGVPPWDPAPNNDSFGNRIIRYMYIYIYICIYIYVYVYIYIYIYPGSVHTQVSQYGPLWGSSLRSSSKCPWRLIIFNQRTTPMRPLSLLRRRWQAAVIFAFGSHRYWWQGGGGGKWWDSYSKNAVLKCFTMSTKKINIEKGGGRGALLGFAGPHRTLWEPML